jgi:hypothetical protein
MTRAALYELRNRLFLHAYARTEAGFWLASEPALALRSDATDDVLGRALLNVLTHKLPVRPTPSRDDYVDIDDPVLRASGLKSWTQLHRQARMCDVELDSARLRFIPTRNERRDGVRAFYDDSSQIIESACLEPLLLGAAARSGLAAATLV